jgi:hypothetical protein
MSIFDVIKYSGTNLGSIDELEALPEELMDLYRKETGYWRRETHIQRCTEMAWRWEVSDPKWRAEFLYKPFIEAVKEYSERDEE